VQDAFMLVDNTCEIYCYFLYLIVHFCSETKYFSPPVHVLMIHILESYGPMVKFINIIHVAALPFGISSGLWNLHSWHVIAFMAVKVFLWHTPLVF
jgi:hypothetical protein